MRRFIARLYKQYESDAEIPQGENNVYALFGHFDYMQLVSLQSSDTAEAFKTEEIETALSHSWKGFDLQSVCLFDTEAAEGQCEKDALTCLVEAESNLGDDAMPLCVLVMAEDSYKAGDNTFGTLEYLNGHAEKYKKWWNEYFEKFQTNVAREAGETVHANMNVFHTLDCTDVVLLFRTNSFQVAHGFMCDLTRKHDIVSSYSLMGVYWQEGLDELFRYNPHSLLQSDKDLELSIRIIFRTDVSIDKEMKKIEEFLTARNADVTYTRTTLAGNHHFLFLFSKGVYLVLSELFSSDGIFSSRTHSLSVCRTSLRFKGYELELDVSEPIEGESEHSLTDNLTTEYKKICEQWKGYESLFLDGMHSAFNRLKNYAGSIEIVMDQHMGFFRSLEHQRKQRVNPEIYGSLELPLMSLCKITENYGDMLRTVYEDAEDKNRISSLLSIQEMYLDQIKSCIETIGRHIRNLVHMQRSLIEERGLFQNEVAATAKLSLSYAEYATQLCRRLYVTEKKDDNSEQPIPFSFYISFSVMKNNVTATEQFLFLHLYRQAQQHKATDSIIHIQIAQHSVFNFQEVKTAIIHEVSHYVGWRNRPLRAECIVQSMCEWFVHQLLPLYCYNQDNGSETGKRFKCFFESYEDQISEHRLELINPLIKKLQEATLIHLQNTFSKELEGTYQHLLCEELIQIFEAFAKGPVTISGQNGESLVIDISLDVVNASRQMENKISDLFLQWYGSKASSDDSVLAYNASRTFNLDMYASARVNMSNILLQLNQHLFYGYQTNMAFARTQIQNGALMRESKSDTAEREKQADTREEAYSYSIAKMVETFCHTYSETYCDMVAIRLLGLKKKQYISYVWYKDGVDYSDYWRVATVIKMAFDEDDKEMQDGAGGLISFQDSLNKYLRSTLDGEQMRSLFSASPSSTCSSQTASAQFFELYRHYLNLRQRGQKK